MNLFKLGILLAGTAAAAAAIAELIRDKENEDMDQWLMEDEEVLPDLPDTVLWEEMEEEDLPAAIRYQVKNPEAAQALQTFLAEAGINSSAQEDIVEALFLGGQEQAKALAEACTLPDVTYVGFTTAQ